MPGEALTVPRERAEIAAGGGFAFGRNRARFRDPSAVPGALIADGRPSLTEDARRGCHDPTIVGCPGNFG
jgi:hypothetical protein